MKKESEKQEEKKKEQKIIYIDDGSTIADMSGTFKKGKEPRPRSTFKDKVKTYLSVVKKMILPMIITLLAFTLAYVLLLLAAGKLF